MTPTRSLTAKVRTEFSSGDVERREGRTHGLPEPIRPGDEGFQEQLRDTLILCQAAKLDAEPWPEEVKTVLLRHWVGVQNGTNVFQIEHAAKQIGFSSWREIVDFVRDDECIDGLRLLLPWVRSRYDRHEVEGFIDGGGVGDYDRYTDRLRYQLQETFDEKWHWMLPRPEEVMEDMTGCREIGVYPQPGHPSYPAGHGRKFATVDQYLNDHFCLDDYGRFVVRAATYLLAMARTGGGVHYPQDNLVYFG